MFFNRKSGHTLRDRREAADRAHDMGAYYSQETVSVPLPDGGRVEVSNRSNCEWPQRRNVDHTETTYDKHGRVLEVRRTRR